MRWATCTRDSVVRLYLHGRIDCRRSGKRRSELERNEAGPTLLQIGDSPAGDLLHHVSPWVGSIYVYVKDVDYPQVRLSRTPVVGNSKH
jgi:hypothetical protein